MGSLDEEVNPPRVARALSGRSPVGVEGCDRCSSVGEGWCLKDGCWIGPLSSTMANGVNWSSEALWIPRQPISLRAGRDVGRSQGFNNAQHADCSAFWMANCQQDDKLSRE